MIPGRKNDSPCTGICRISGTGGYCIGCFRTIDEITSWPHLGRKEKEKIYSEIEKRKKA